MTQNQITQQMVIVAQAEIDGNQTPVYAALFNADGTPFSGSSGGEVDLSGYITIEYYVTTYTVIKDILSDVASQLTDLTARVTALEPAPAKPKKVLWDV